MSTPPFTHLHLHTEYSTLDGINKVKELPKVCKEHGMTACSITDHGNVAGAWNFYQACQEEKIQPIIGMEAYYTCGDRTAREKDDLDSAYYHVILLAASNKGLHNLFKLSTHSYTEGIYYKPRIDDALLADYSEDIIATSACLGSRSSQLILRGEYKQAENLLAHHAEIFKDRFFLELQVHKDEHQKKVNEALISIGSRMNLPLVLTADAHYTHKHEKHLHETTLRMATDGAGDGFSFGEIEVYIGDHADMLARSEAAGIPYEAISNTEHIRQRINSADYFSDRRNRYPRFKSLPAGLTSWQYLQATAQAGLHQRIKFPVPTVYQERLDQELKVLKKLGLSDYMLIVAEYTKKATDLGVLVGPGRGSAVGSLVAYCLGITQIDPLKYGLVFERFLNEGRGATPLIF